MRLKLWKIWGPFGKETNGQTIKGSRMHIMNVYYIMYKNVKMKYSDLLNQFPKC